MRALRLRLVATGVIGLAFTACRKLAFGIGIVRIRSPIVLRCEKAGQVLARRRQRQHFLATLVEGTHEIGLERLDQPLSYFRFLHGFPRISLLQDPRPKFSPSFCAQLVGLTISNRHAI